MDSVCMYPCALFMQQNIFLHTFREVVQQVVAATFLKKGCGGSIRDWSLVKPLAQVIEKNTDCGVSRLCLILINTASVAVRTSD